IKIKDLAEQMIKLSGRIPNRDIHIEFTGLRPGEKLYEELLADEENTTKTHHEKIMIGNPTNPFTTQELYELSEKLCRLIINHQPTEAVELLKIMVPEYQCEIKQGA